MKEALLIAAIWNTSAISSTRPGKQKKRISQRISRPAHRPASTTWRGEHGALGGKNYRRRRRRISAAYCEPSFRAAVRSALQREVCRRWLLPSTVRGAHVHRQRSLYRSRTEHAGYAMDLSASVIGGKRFDFPSAIRSRELTLKAFLLAGGHGTRLRPLD